MIPPDLRPELQAALNAFWRTRSSAGFAAPAPRHELAARRLRDLLIELPERERTVFWKPFPRCTRFVWPTPGGLASKTTGEGSPRSITLSQPLQSARAGARADIRPGVRLA